MRMNEDTKRIINDPFMITFEIDLKNEVFRMHCNHISWKELSIGIELVFL